MAKTLIISSDSPDEDMQAAFTIVKESEKDQRLDKIIWYSNIGKTLVRYDERLVALEKHFATLTDCLSKLGIDMKREFEKIARLEKGLADLKKPSKEPTKGASA